MTSLSRAARCVPLLLALANHAAAQLPAGTSVTSTAPAKKVTAVRVKNGAVHLDGRLDEAVWRDATPIADFVQKLPVEGAAPTERTEVRLAYDDDALYVGARMYSRDPSQIQAPISRRDNVSTAEHLLISLDTYHNRRTAYTFGVTASGVRADWYHARDSETDIDQSFDPVWEARSAVDSAGWTAEMRIPFSQLRFNASDVQTWGVNFDRWIPSRNEDVFWIPVSSRETAWSSRFGELNGISGVQPSRRIELLPYVATDATLAGDPHPRDPFTNGANLGARVGGDLKMGLGPGLTLQATVNPDFGQVEADPAVVNLSAFEVTFPEKRPFFVEGSQLLQSPTAGYFYSRRVGAAPRGPASGDFVDRPLNSTILGATKLSGQLRSGTSIGVLAAVTDREYATTFDTAGVDGAGDPFPQARNRVRVAPLTSFGIARVSQQFGKSASTAGAILTGVHRLMSDDDPLANLLDRDAVTGGVDWNLRFRGGRYEWAGGVGFSHVRGDSLSLLRIQRSSARYFQRPDADYVEVDPSRTSLSGYAATTSFERRSGEHWLWSAYSGTESPGFELNDAGRIGTADDIFGGAEVTWRETKRHGVFQSYGTSLGQENEWSTDFDRQFGAIRWDGNITWKNFWTTNATLWHDFEGQDNRATRGGPSMGHPGNVTGIFALGNSFSSKTRWTARIYYGRDDFGGILERISGSLSVRPGPRWQLSIAPNWLRESNFRQYVQNAADGPAETFGTRYIFGHIQRIDFFADARLAYTLTPDLSLEVFAEPFAASGQYDRLGHLVAARSDSLHEYGRDGGTISRDETTGDFTVTEGGETFTIGNPDFNLRSLRSNIVMRWEWRPGSTLFVVWQQNGDHSLNRVRQVRPGDLFSSFGGRSDNFLAVKVQWFVHL